MWINLGKFVCFVYSLYNKYIIKKIKTTVRTVILKNRPKDRVIKPKLMWTVEKPIFKALKKKLFTGPWGKMFAKKYDSAEPIIPPIIIPKIIVLKFLFDAINLLYARKAKKQNFRDNNTNPYRSLNFLS